ncbi:MAG TPA: type I 3-dehydroquinate dehydratase, partial [Terriglobales bacterium]|nr:type I 3-dehydroquinate dehydratase [Terriglobales bacterium]
MTSAPISTAARMLPLRLPKVCVALAADNPSDMVSKAEALVRDNPLLEFRLDYIPQPASALPKIKRFLETHPSAVLIGTCRRAVNGGKFRGSVASQLEILSKAASAGCQLVDFELQSAEDAKRGTVERLRSKAAVILSYHDFRSTKKL